MHQILPAGRELLLMTLLLALAGCGGRAEPLHPIENSAAAPPALGADFDPRRTGSIRGQVVWAGPIPEPRSFQDAKITAPATAARIEAKNLLLPKIEAAGKGVSGAVVYLRAVESARSRPWDLPPVRVEMKDGQIAVVQGEDGPHTAGFVRAGDPVEMISLSKPLEMLRGRGAAFFTLSFPEPDRGLTRSFAKPGLIEFSSGAGNYWARSFLFVVEHPYVVRTTADGRFALENVPDGDYELVCWLPNWKVDRFERDPENLTIARLWYCPPLEKSVSVSVEQGKTTEVKFTLSSGGFSDKK